MYSLDDQFVLKSQRMYKTVKMQRTVTVSSLLKLKTVDTTRLLKASQTNASHPLPPSVVFDIYRTQTVILDRRIPSVGHL